MQSLVDFFEKETDKKINIFEYNNVELNNNQNLITFNDKVYVVEIQNKFILDNNIIGHLYVFYQENLNFDNLKGILENLYENINIFQYNQYLIVNSSDKLDMDISIIETIESETYRTTFVVYLDKINNIDIFNARMSVVDDILPLIIYNSNLNKFTKLNDLTVYKIISLMSKENIFYNLIDFDIINNMDENLLHTGISFIENDLNISKTSSVLFLHRNTLIYKLEKIKEILNLDLKNFKDALVFYMSIKSHFTHKFYTLKKGKDSRS